jgi:hypothetical protein
MEFFFVKGRNFSKDSKREFFAGSDEKWKENNFAQFRLKILKPNLSSHISHLKST